jgi:hypothetical protein
MNQDFAPGSDRRGTPRFSINACLTIFSGGRSILAYTRDLSNRGAYFYLSSADSERLGREFDFMVELPPEITLSAVCQIRCKGRAVRFDDSPGDLTGVAVEILNYSILRQTMSAA